MKDERNALIKNIHTTYHWRVSLLYRLSNFKCWAAKDVMSGTLLEIKAPVVQTSDSAIHRIYHYPADKY